ncbi:hypothetical protein F4827_003626 [Paraburkholderia bannensis]|uniref:Uncharacterized protein n=1 Tax=Paraburkholderia bannensis TaxID=765414 RepID=A0A7W9TYJ4_9BURK|nr:MULTISPECIES: hypothetical protein [Paraburkholderia]MBB3258757.1 hypothetical protein [Paraburkholderia sp. WP4_3_2]MBB6103771.1 hypothetical protein [Paraburkholderia bannensis]
MRKSRLGGVEDGVDEGAGRVGRRGVARGIGSDVVTGYAPADDAAHEAGTA